MSEEQEITSALNVLQTALRKKFGKGVECASGQCTLFISPSGVELTDEGGTVIAWDAGESVAELLK